ncbi:mitochondrial enolase superfamily member 1-like [Nylanderia fulva]|uniref:mitochondrial enolase superfamily member 1-like n=1 Tax=Nylanderia fulva TaxID=613905 RepID=UPI0010FB0F84|nr:mitochondrial enolase superfamily member 1-like [Nylanderia fulva]
MIDAKIIDFDVQDIRFPTSLKGDGSDAMYTKVDHSCVYVTIKTDKEYEGYGITCSMGRGNELILQTCKLLFELIKNQTTIEIYSNFASVWRKLTSDAEFRWIGPECGVIHLATAAIVNALWDLWARIENKPVWKLLVDMTPEQLVSTVDFRYIKNILSEEEAIQMLKENESKKKLQEELLRKCGYPASTSDIGWVGYSYQKTRGLAKKFVKLNFNTFKVNVDNKIKNSVKRCRAVRDVAGWKNKRLILDASQAWDVLEVADNIQHFKHFKLFCIEDVMAPDDFVGVTFMKFDKELFPCSIGKMCANRVIYKGFHKLKAFTFWQLNVARLGGVNEALAVYFMAKKKNVSIWGYANGVGLGEMIQHLQMWDFVCLNQTTENRMIEFVNRNHGYFKNPVHIQNACYMPPKDSGFSTKLKDKFIVRWSYPDGTRWKYLFITKHFKNENEDN